MKPDQIVAVGLLTATDVARFGRSFDRLYPVDEVQCFAELLQAVDDADRELHRSRDQARE